MINNKFFRMNMFFLAVLALCGIPKTYSSVENKSRKEFIKQAFRDVIENMDANEKAYAKYFSKNYVQHVDGKTLNYDDFVRHMKHQKEAVKSIHINFQHMVAEGNRVFTIHFADVVKKNNAQVKIKVIAMFVIEDGKITKCDELTHLVKGGTSDRDLGSR